MPLFNCVLINKKDDDHIVISFMQDSKKL